MKTRESEVSSSNSVLKQFVRSFVLSVFGVMILLLAQTTVKAELLYALDGTNATQRLISFDSATPGTIASSVAITGLQANEFLIGIDFRPANNTLYTIGSTNQLYSINQTTGAATPVGTPITPGIDPAQFYGFDFNPVPDRLRLVNGANENMRIDPNTGVRTTDTPLAFAMGDPNFGVDPNVVHSAYTNNFAGATTTTLYDIDSTLNALVRQGSVNGTPSSPNTGELFTIGPLGVNPSESGGFDISGATGTPYALLNIAGVRQLFTINLTTGAATLIGTVGDGTLFLDGLTVGQTAPPPFEILYALDGTGGTMRLISFNSTRPQTIVGNVTITGLQPNEFLIGIDVRPSNAMIYTIGSTSQVYTINPMTGAATPVGAPFGVALDPNEFYGFDFNPVPDLIRLTNGADINLRINPNTGALAFTDTNLAFAAGDPNASMNPNVVHSAYTNNNPGATTTTLYDIDSTLNILTIQNPPNSGTLNTVGPLGVNPTQAGGFDISGATGMAYALLNVPMFGSQLFTINLTTGAATLVGTVGDGTLFLDGLTVARNVATAAGVTVGGRVLTANGGAIAKAKVTLTDEGGNVRTATTDRAGRYRFEDVEAGKTYIFGVSTRQYRFAQPTQAIFVSENLDEVNFTANR